MSRKLAVVILIILATGVLWGMWRSWKQQTRREQDKINPLPKAPQKLGAHLHSYPEVIYVSTVFHGKYLERVHAYKLGGADQSTSSYLPKRPSHYRSQWPGPEPGMGQPH